MSVLAARFAGAAEAIPSEADLRAQFEILVASGGSEALWPDPLTGRTPSGSIYQPAPHEIWLSSTDATAPSPHGHGEALQALLSLMGGQGAGPGGLTLSRWFEGLRTRLTAQFGSPFSTAFLAPSIAAGRDLARAIAFGVHGSVLSEISTGLAECSDFPVPDQLLDIPLRGDDGLPRLATDIEEEVADALALMGRPVLLHLLDRSRGGLRGVSRAWARDYEQRGDAFTVVDATAMRADADSLRADVQEGRCVLVSGSTFLNGPEGCAALIVPDDILARMKHLPPAHLVQDLRAYDVPYLWREPLLGGATGRVNIGLGLRWTAALAEAERYFAIPSALRQAVLESFTNKVRARLTRCEHLLPDAYGDMLDPIRDAIVPLVIPDEIDATAQATAARLRLRLALPLDEQGDAICHLGAPLHLSVQAALPLSASATMVSDVARRIERGISFERALAPLLRDIDTLFLKIERLA